MTPVRTTVRHSASRQNGIVLIVALVVLIIMTLAGLAMLRQMGGGLSIAGNLAFKQGATAIADMGTERARVWLAAQTAATLSTSSSANGYVATWGTSVDPTDASFAWSTAPTVADASGNTVSYIIHRLCQVEGLDANAPTQHCSDTGDNNAGVSKGGGSYGSTPIASFSSPYFRVTTRVTGPRNTVSYTQVVLN